ncbi:MAG TPA: glucosamine-6-phosphate deaminase [Propionibacterium sp.]|nr:glucosamine-6-phosphate deaminase [Propionibacterium sp.]
MEIIIVANEEEVGRVAADKVIEHLSGLATPVIGLATGSSPLGLYAELARRQDEGDIDFSHALGFALDEYVGIDPAHPESYRNVINRTVVEPLRMAPERVRVPDGAAEDLEAAVEEYDAAIEAVGGVDVQVLGIGSNGHIGFNEPFSSFSSRTRVEVLTPQTREDNARFFDSLDQVPTHCVTQGLGTIMDSHCAVMVVTGEHKADAVAAMVEGPVAAVMPASILQFHPNCIVVIDEAAASKLQHADLFR